MSRQPSKVRVKVLDRDRFLSRCSEEAGEKLTMFYNLGLVETPSGSYILNTEGVGSEDVVSEENPFELQLHKDSGTGISIFPSKVFTCEDASEMPWSDEEIPLHEFIRTFGSRLESNYMLWKRFLETQNKEVQS